MTPKLLERVQDFFGMKPQVFKAKEDTITPDAVVDYKPTLAQRFAHELETIVDQMLEFEREADRFKSHTYINELGKKNFGNMNKGPALSFQEQAMQLAEKALDDMVSSLGAPFGAPSMKLGKQRSKRDKDAYGYDASSDADLDMSNKRSSVTLFDGTVLTYTKEVASDGEIKATQPKLEILTTDGEKLTANLSDRDGIQRIIDEVPEGQLDSILSQDMRSIKQSINASRHALADAQFGDFLPGPDLDKMMLDARPGPNGPN